MQHNGKVINRRTNDSNIMIKLGAQCGWAKSPSFLVERQEITTKIDN